ncbi:hypothetical protein AOL_s00075g52 [Orbilia oligospora ATCC 24927]|uniref:Uncharacterized protein n=1 Tax=Arthrobotrys oligospora (strain ATCC 24927 / CBS 115.81 / DSM 1491) TaxID=756982 RepID=G1X853_ARTOA|nr:hypothetical protein AOL_s00075g52 [Orbilia oligospora ATCC 24927]EGX50626.1 hypothetical protein AOL_s00075g52 [Orbilia oligospora ATCC 24927]
MNLSRREERWAERRAARKDARAMREQAREIRRAGEQVSRALREEERHVEIHKAKELLRQALRGGEQLKVAENQTAIGCINSGPRLFSNLDVSADPGHQTPEETIESLRERDKKYDIPFSIEELLKFPVKSIGHLLQNRGDIKYCTNVACTFTREKFMAIAPRIPEYPKLQDLILTVLSCWVANSTPKTPCPKLKTAGRFCVHFLEACSASLPALIESSKTDKSLQKLFRICELFYFVVTIMAGGMTLDLNGIATQAIFSPSMIEQVVYSCGTIDKAPEGVCKHRLWNLASSSARGLVEIFSISEMVRQEGCELSSKFHLEKHGACNVQICQLNDENTTKVPQLHLLCKSQNCGTINFSQAKLNKIDIAEISKPGATAWTLNEKDPQPGAKNYLAISHVWANGTGVGEHTPGNVNRCLFRYFKTIA